MLPSVNWDAISSDSSLKGIIAYKAGMKSVLVKDNTADSMTNGKNKVLPVTIVECPPMKILSVRFYKDGVVKNEILNSNIEKELKKKIKLPKNNKSLDSVKTDQYDDIRVIIYSQVKKTNIKKKPDLLEIGLSGSFDDKLNFVKEKLDKEILASEVIKDAQLVDIRATTKGKGTQGPVKRFGIQLKVRKAEKGRRRPGSIGPWHPARVIFRVPMAGQLGLFTRAAYNSKVIKIGNDEIKNIKNYGDIKTEYIILQGSVQGPSKRQLVLTMPLRPTKKQLKKEYEFIELR